MKIKNLIQILGELQTKDKRNDDEDVKKGNNIARESRKEEDRDGSTKKSWGVLKRVMKEENNRGLESKND